MLFNKQAITALLSKFDDAVIAFIDPLGRLQDDIQASVLILIACNIHFV